MAAASCPSREGVVETPRTSGMRTLCDAEPLKAAVDLAGVWLKRLTNLWLLDEEGAVAVGMMDCLRP
jgi:hypothetical protein